MSVKIGDLLKDRYKIEALLGQGAMGAVFRASDTLPRIPVSVALKEFRMGDLPTGDQTRLHQEPDTTRTHSNQKRPSTFTREKAVEQFKREAQILYEFHHPNLPRVTDWFREGDEYYLVMELIEGLDLDTKQVQNGDQPFAKRQVFAWLSQVLDALEYCHSQGIVHRDIKPANIIVTPNGKAYLVDFGISRLAEVGNMTLVRGRTSGFSPLEQYTRRGQIDERSDIYALGATLYDLLTGQPPEDAVERVAGSELVLPRTINASISTQTEAVIIKALAIKPEDRFQNIGEIRKNLLEGFEPQSTEKLTAQVSARQSNQPDRKPVENAKSVPHSIPVEPSNIGHLIHTLKAGKSGISAIAFSPDGRILAAGGDDGIIKNIKVSDYSVRIACKHQGEVWSLAFSPDGWELASGSSDNKVFITCIPDFESIRVLNRHTDWVLQVKYSPDNNYLATASADQTIALWNLEGYDLFEMIPVPSQEVTCLAFSPIRNYLVAGTSEGNVILWSVPGLKKKKTIDHAPYWVNDITFSPNGKYLAIAYAFSVKILDGHNWETVINLDLGHGEGNSIAFSPDGFLLATGATDGKVRLWKTSDWSLLLVLPGHKTGVNCLAFSPDGALLASGSKDRTIRFWKIH